MKRKLFWIFFIFLLLVFIGSTIGIGLVLYRYHQADVVYEDLQDRYVTRVEPPADRPSVGPSGSPPAQGTYDPSLAPEPVLEWAPVAVDFEALLAENGDVVGWLYCEGTPINYPVMQAADNDRYLHRGLNGEYLYSGTPFADYRCSVAGTDRNYIIYGHNMKNDTMFGTLDEYKGQSYYDEHPVLYYLTPERDYKIELFSGLVTKADSEVYDLQFRDEEAFEDFLRGLREHSTFRSDVSVTGADRIVTLSTCSYEFNNARYVIFGKLTALSRP